MKIRTCLLASALLLAPASAMAQTADCANDITRVADQLAAAHAKAGIAAEPNAPQGTPSSWAITWNRMGTASENANAASLPPRQVAPSGAEGLVAGSADAGAPADWANATANALARVQDSLQSAQAAHARGDEAACQREIADAQRQLDAMS